MKKVEKKILAAVICTMMLVISSILAGCSININMDDGDKKTVTAAPTKAVTPTVSATPTPKKEQQTGSVQGPQQNKPEQNDQQTGDDGTNDDETNQDSQDPDNDGDGVDIVTEEPSEVTLFDNDGGEIVLTRADDGEFYDEEGVLYPSVDELRSGDHPVTNENGETYYWIPPQDASSMVLWNADGDSVIVQKNRATGIWYDESGISYGDVWSSFDNGEYIIDENGVSYYWQPFEQVEPDIPDEEE